MERFTDLAIVLRSFRYAERDMVVHLLTENHGKITGLAKNAVHSRRFGGTLQTLAVSNISWAVKPHAEMARIEEAVIRHEFKGLPQDYESMAAAAFVAEFCSKVLEPGVPQRELFLCLTNALHQLDGGVLPLAAVNAFLVKGLRHLGYAPNLTHCGDCHEAADVIARAQPDDPFYWDDSGGALLCARCLRTALVRRTNQELDPALIVLYCALLARPFKDLGGISGPHVALFELLKGFMHHHIPALHAGGGLKTLNLMDFAAHPSP